MMEQKESADWEVIGLSTSCGVEGDRAVFMAAVMRYLMKIKLWFTGEFFFVVSFGQTCLLYLSYSI